MSCWFNTADNTSRNLIQLTPTDKLEIDVNKKVSATFASPQTKVYLNANDDTHSSNYNGSTSLKINNWYFACVTNTTEIISHPDYTRIGYDGVAGSFFSGSLSDVRMYNVELTTLLLNSCSKNIMIF